MLEAISHSRTVASIFFLAGLLLLRHLGLRGIAQRKNVPAKIRRRWIAALRNVVLVLLVVGMGVVWSNQIRAITATMMVVAVAIVLATKEYFLNLTGFLFRSTAQFFAVGDRIEVGDLRGDVIDQSFLGITLMEISKNNLYTGSAIFIPNLKFLTVSVRNETYTKDFVFHFITVPVKLDDKWQVSRDALLEAGRKVCRPFLKEAREYMKEVADRHSLDTPPIEPRIYTNLPKPDQINLVLRVPMPARRRGRLEQEIVQAYMQNLGKSTSPQGAAAAETGQGPGDASQ